MRLSVIQTSPLYLKRDRNLKSIEHLVGKTKGDLVVLPELCSSGYNFQTKSDLNKVAEPALTGPTARLLSKLAKKKQQAIVAGFPEKKNKHFYNSALIVTPQKIDVYRKIHLFSNEKKFFKPGTQKPKVYTYKKMKFGVMICFDWLFPEMARLLALKKADVIAHPSNLVMPYAPRGMQIRSLENHVFSVTANRVGTEFGLKFIGQSQILGEKGQVLARFKKQVGVKTVSINLKKARNKKITAVNDVLKDRRIRFY